jgi:hypothetical protein
MNKKLALVPASLLVAGVLTLGGASPAMAATPAPAPSASTLGESVQQAADLAQSISDRIIGASLAIQLQKAVDLAQTAADLVIEKANAAS